MKKRILWSALATLVGTTAYAEQVQPVAPAAAPANPAPAAQVAPAAPVAQPATTAQPQAIPSAPVSTATTSEPVMSCDYKISPDVKKVEQNIVLSWSEHAVMQAFSFNPVTIEDQIQKLQPCFTEQGWSGFNTALQKSGNIEAIKSQKLTVTSQIDGQILVNEAKDNQWKLTLPLSVVYQNDKEKVSQLLSVDVTVGRKTNGDLGIMQMIAAPRGTVTTTKPVDTSVKPAGASGSEAQPASGEANPASAPATAPAAPATQPETDESEKPPIGKPQ